MTPRFQAVVFDLDGTLTKSDPGILNGVRYALERLQAPPQPEEVLRLFIGPPLWNSFHDSCGLSADEAIRATALFREYYNTRGVYENSLYPHVMELLTALRDAGCRVCVATSKAAASANLVVDHFRLRPLLAGMATAQDSDRSSGKETLIGRALEACGVAPERAVMVGDTRFDASGARLAGVSFLGVLYGYGTREEMEAEGAERFARDVPELGRHLLRASE